jgi:hypothetical protein
MIYKLTQPEASKVLEVELLNETNQPKSAPDVISFVIADTDDLSNGFQIDLNKTQVYKLIGALHLLHKEMK